MAFIRSAPEPADAAFLAGFDAVAAAAARVDGHRPFSEQAGFDVGAGRRTAVLVTGRGGRVVGAGITGHGELDLVIDPADRRNGHAVRALEALLPVAPADVTAWSHGDHPAARVLAGRFGFAAERTLLQLRAELTAAGAIPNAADGAVIDAFRPGIDDAAWVDLNAVVFAGHPEQGSLGLGDLAARQAEPWFDADDFLLARDRGTGRLIGYTWLKVVAGSPVGEIYVLGVHPAAAGRGLGRGLLQAGLARLRSRGCRVAELFVEADSAAAVHLYRTLGFTEHTVDVQYRRRPR